MKILWYYFVKIYVRTSFKFYFKKVEIVGIENVPKDAAVLFVANHQNALIDPLLLGAFIPRQLHFLTRADVFYKPVVRALLSSVNMLPIYRIRDGRGGLSKNEEVFQTCYSILKDKGTVLIFPEGNHNIQRRVRVLSKGFTRIVFGAIENSGNQELMVVPVGINYTNARQYASKVSLNIGKPVLANDFYTRQNTNEGTVALKKEVSNRLKELVTHIEDLENYEMLEKSFHEDEFLSPESVNNRLKNPENLVPMTFESGRSFNFLLPLVTVNSFFPLLIWKWLFQKIKEEEFIATYKFALGMTAFPFFYLLQTWILGAFFGTTTAVIYFILSLLSLYLLTKSR